MRRLEILLISDFDRPTATTVRDHIDSFGMYSRHRFRHVRMLGDLPPRLDLSRFDGIIVHYTLVACMENYVSLATRARLKAFTGLKAMFIQDEYRFVNRTLDAMRDIGIDLLFTCVPEPEIEKVYSPQALPGVVKINVLTGYVPQKLLKRKVPRPSERPIDIGYRSRRVPEYLGRLGCEKWQIAERVAADAPKFHLVTDISCREEDRIYGEAWIDFISSCRATLGAESGASVFDFTGEIERQMRDHLGRDPNVRYETLDQLYLAEHEGKIRLNQISPRCFEAAALRTLMILYEGNYSGILKPWRHYVPLKKDHSNMAEVVSVLRDATRIADITQRTYQEIALDPRYSYANAVAQVDTAIETTIRPEMISQKSCYSTPSFRLACLGDVTVFYRRVRNIVVELARRLVVPLARRCMSEQRWEEVRHRIRKWRGIETAGEP